MSPHRARSRGLTDSDTLPVPTRDRRTCPGQRQALALRQCPDRAPRQNLRRRLDVERIVPRQRQPVRSLDVDVEIGGAGAAGIERQRIESALGGELHGGGGIARHLHRARGLDADAVIAGRALDIVEIETHRALVAIEQEARRVAVSTTGSRTVTSIVARPSFVEFHATAITRAVPANSEYRN